MTTPTDRRRQLQTRLSQHQPPEALHAVAPPIWQTTTFATDDPGHFLAMATEPHHPAFYTRYGNPTTRTVEEMIATAEGTQAALAYASGIAAITGPLLALVGQGQHIVGQTVLYGGVLGFLGSVAPRLGIEVSLVDQSDTRALIDAIRPGQTRLVLLESPSNPMLQVTDLAAVAAAAKAAEAVTLVDNTIATPLNQTPAEFGIDLVMHAATKYLAGHSDVMAGVVCGSKALIEQIWQTSFMLGATLGPIDAWLLLRGLRSFPARMSQINATGQAVAAFLEAHPKVSRVYYPGLASHPQRSLAERQMPGGAGGLLSFEVDGDAAAAERVVAGTTIAKRAASFGSFGTLIVHPAAMWAGMMDENSAANSPVPSSLIRLGVGLEAAEDLITDLEQALAGL